MVNARNHRGDDRIERINNIVDAYFELDTKGKLELLTGILSVLQKDSDYIFNEPNFFVAGVDEHLDNRPAGKILQYPSVKI